MDLRINYSETISTGNTVTSKGGEFSTLLSRIQNVNAELSSYWEGSDASKYTSAVAEQIELMNKLNETINEIGGFLVKVGNAYREASENNAAGIKG